MRGFRLLTDPYCPGEFRGESSFYPNTPACGAGGGKIVGPPAFGQMWQKLLLLHYRLLQSISLRIR
jgi:hypothetical protein